MRFSSGSATRSCISCAVAPGHTAATVNTLIVKVGSSARPSFRKAKMPAATIAITLFLLIAIVAAGIFAFLKLGRAEDPIAISKNRVIAFSRTARADRLRNCFAAESGTWGPELPRSGSDFSFFCDLWCWLIEFLPCSQRARVDHREANERQALRPVVLGAGSR